MKTHVLVAVVAILAACEAPGPPTLFELRSADETGIHFANRLQEDDSVYNPLDFDYLYNGAGVALADLNDDGLLDVYLAGNMVSSRLYLNRGDLRFEDVTDAAGVGTDVWATGVAAADVNGDGLPDLYVCIAGLTPESDRWNRLFINQGPDENDVPRFREAAREYGVDDTGYSTHAAFLDYDRDGDLDLYVLTNALEASNRNAIRPKRTDGGGRSTDRLYRNNGDGTFTNVSAEAGILIEGYGLGVVVSDLNRDGWPDLYVANDFLSNDLVWVNNRDGTFTNRAADYLKHQTHNGMGADVADYDNDGLADILVLDMLPPDNHRKKMMLMGGNYDKFHMGLDLGYQPQYMRNTLQHNVGLGPDGQPRFSEIGQLAGIHQTDWSWAPLLADFDNDGYKDLFVSNGYRRDVTNLDFVLFLREGVRERDPVERVRLLQEGLRDLPEVELPNYGFRNNGDLTFEDRSHAWGLDVPSYSNGAAYGDLDNDGDLDLVVNNLDQDAFVFENRAVQQQTGHFLEIALDGPAGNRAGLGASVVVQAGGVRQFVENSPYRGYKGSVDSRLHFGLGSARTAEVVEVQWPDGTRERRTGVAADGMIRFDHADAATPEASADPATEASADPAADASPDRDADLAPDRVTDTDPVDDPAAPANPVERGSGRAEPLFRTAPGPAFRHQEREVAEFRMTPLLPHKFSIGGPGIAVGDLDGDGRDDVFAGTDRGNPDSVYLQTRTGRFEAVALEGGEAFEDMAALIFDADGDGDNDLYVVSGGNLAAETPKLYQDRLYVNDGRGGLRIDPDALPETGASGSGVTAADYDGDGDLDLFVGGRIRPGSYPLPPRSYLLRNDTRPGDPPRFTDVTEQIAPGLARAGLVNTGLWTDYDGDGRVDLMLAGEWMDLTVFRNTGDGFVDATAAAGLEGTEGWWNSLVAGDFDDDGDTDYLAGNLGLNSKYRASPEEPVRVHAADFDHNGSIDPVLSHYIDGRSYAIASRDKLIDQMMAMTGRFPHYIDYAEAPLDRTLSPAEQDSALVLRAVRFASSYLENRGDGTFTVASLPIAAQVAPIFGMLTGDFDGDGHLDVAAVGNSSAPDIETGAYDASYGLLLLGDGRGGFRPAEGTTTGFFVPGEGRGIAELAVDGSRSLVLATQNDDRALAFLPLGAREAAHLPVDPLDSWAEITLADGRIRRVELSYGSSYLSQSSRFLRVPPGARSVVLHDSRGDGRNVGF